MNAVINFIKNTDEGVIFCVKLIPNSSFNKIVDYTQDYVRIKISSPPIENRANKELISFCSKFLDVNKSKIHIISGEKSRLKKVLIKDVNAEEIIQKFLFVLNSVHNHKEK